jgi:acyl-CoA hydrolase
MKLMGTKTEKNLWAAFAAESQARNRYIYFGDKAREAGHDDVADVFHELAANEGEHARREFEFLGGIGEVKDNIEKSAEGEHLEYKDIYPSFAQVAREEGFIDIAEFFERMGEVEGTHEQRCRALMKSLDGIEEFKGRTVLRSATRMAQIMLPAQANPAGFVHGGELMKMVDNAAGVAAIRHCQKNIVLGRVADIQFHRPVEVGSLVLLHARLTYVSRSSMEVKIELDMESLWSGERTRALTAYFIMVALEEDGKSAEVPPLLISTEEQQRLYEEGKARYEEYRKSK